MNNLCVDLGWRSINKHGEQLCGDRVQIIEPSADSVVMVLADGLGSGVKANILSTLTSKIISTMMASNMALENCVQTIADTLPVCEVRKVAYSTFTIIRIEHNEYAELIQYDNPLVILLRDGKNYDYDKTAIKLQENDTFITTSDGAIHAGVGMSLNFGWQRENIIEFMEMIYDKDFTAKTLATILLDECNKLYGYQPGDDTTVSVMKVRQRRQVNLMIGPPTDPADDEKMMGLFFSKEGKHIVCGGTTSMVAARFLHQTVQPNLGYLDPEIPPTATIKGVDLVTEGVITISRVLTYAKSYLEANEDYSKWSYKQDGASQISRLLFEEATDINFYVGRAVNPAHQNPDLPINFNIKMRLVDELSDALKQMGKRIKVSYF